jgi:aspartyl-tRNA(Asn)/glutamyl-tRNA(Gln) amidotransferase subunit A
VSELWRLSALQLAALYASGETTPVELFDALDQRIGRIGPAINALIQRAADARDAALASTRRWRDGTARGPLDGVPVAVKDNILARGMPTTWGSRAYAQAVTTDDERPVARLREAGAIIVGKTNCPEFTLEGYTDNALFGVTRNPWNTKLTPGGSSGGSVAGVAAGLFPLALGTDGGGSIRRPASHTGLVGFKPSIGAVARYPSLPQILLDFEVIGPIARTVADATLLYNAIAGPDPRDRLSLAARSAPASLVAPPPLTIRLVMRFEGNALDPEIESSVTAAADTLRRLGHRVETGPLPFDLSPITDFWPLLGRVGLAHLFERDPDARRLAQLKFVEMADAGRAVAAAHYFRGIEAVRVFRHDVTAAFAGFDLIMTPSAAALPWPAEQSHPATIAGEAVGPRGHAVYTGWVNACGHPAISVPCAPSRTGLPIGFQLVGRYGDDERVLQVAAQYESAAPFSQRWPELAERG